LKLGDGKYGNPFVVEKDLGITIPYQIGKSNQQHNMDIAIIMSVSTNDDKFAFDPKYLKSVLLVGDKDNARLNFDSKQESVSQFISELRPIDKKEGKYDAIKKIAKVEVIEEKPVSKEDVMIKIKALKFLAEAGDKDAEKTIKILKFLI
jgi:hypothetical protein